MVPAIALSKPGSEKSAETSTRPPSGVSPHSSAELVEAVIVGSTLSTWWTPSFEPTPVSSSVTSIVTV